MIPSERFRSRARLFTAVVPFLLFSAACLSINKPPRIVLRAHTIYFNGHSLYGLQELESKIRALPEVRGQENQSHVILEVCTDTVTVQQTDSVTSLLEKYGLVYSKEFHPACEDRRPFFSHRVP